jgi:DHA2 family multidrug resistance protein-like MFS transporter
MLALIYGVKQVAERGVDPRAILPIVAGLAIATVFVMRQRRLADPLIDLSLFGIPTFSAAVVTQLVAALSMGGIYLFVAQYLQLVLGLSPLQAGIALVPSNILGIAGTMLAPFLARRFRTIYVITAGMLVSAVGIAVLTRVVSGAPLGTIVTAFIIMSIGFSLAMTLTTDLIMTAAPPERAGAASGISETSAELGMALGVAVLGSVGTALYRSRMENAIPVGIPLDGAVNARATLAGALTVSREAGGPAGENLIAAAREAFSHSLALVSGISAAMVIATSITTLILLRRAGAATDTSSDPQVPAAA